MVRHVTDHVHLPVVTLPPGMTVLNDYGPVRVSAVIHNQLDLHRAKAARGRDRAQHPRLNLRDERMKRHSDVGCAGSDHYDNHDQRTNYGNGSRLNKP